MTLPRWTTFGLFFAIVAQFFFAWVQAKRTGKSFRSAVLPNALIAVVVSVCFAREFFKDVPIWIDAPLAILVCLITLLALALLLVRLIRYLKDAWLEQERE